MIPKHIITEWREKHPWPVQNQVEQDLLISRVLVEHGFSLRKIR
ncbi:MAG: hypothetical protein K940chlam9_01394 [Chlamydiae bacterium]|nr:hypothetical protein [Chlamydiota bacterium]